MKAPISPVYDDNNPRLEDFVKHRVTTGSCRIKAGKIVTLLTGLHPKDIRIVLHMAQIQDMDGKFIDPGDAEGEVPFISLKQFKEMTTEEKIDYLEEQAFEAIRNVSSTENAQMVGRALDFIREQRKERVLETPITLNFVPWYIPDEVADRLYNKAFDGLEIDGMVLKSEEWKTIQEKKDIAKAIRVHAENAGQSMRDYCQNLIEAAV